MSLNEVPRNLFLPILVAVMVFLLTLWARTIIIGTMNLYERLTVIKDFFSITYVRNPGAAFGIFSKLDPSYRVPGLLGISFVALVLIIYFLIKSRRSHWTIRLGLSLLAGGAMGNFYERLIYGAVVDYLDFYLGNYHWPAFNLADVSISSGIGFILLFMVVLRARDENMKERRGQAS